MNDQPNTTPSSQHTHPAKSGEGVKNVLSTVAVLLLAPLLALFLTTFVFQAYQVDGMSMETTLHDKDRLLVWKVPRTWSRITHHAYVPKRGDVVIFNEHKVTGKQLVKRVIGLPGDRVVIQDEMITIYNKDDPQGIHPDKLLPYGKTVTPPHDQVDQVLKKNQVFVIGDNRDNSLDSRIFGPLNTNDIVGKLAARVWPITNTKSF